MTSLERTDVAFAVRTTLCRLFGALCVLALTAPAPATPTAPQAKLRVEEGNPRRPPFGVMFDRLVQVGLEFEAR